MDNELTYENLLQLIKEIRTEPNGEYQLAFPEWVIAENRERFDFRDNKVYFHGAKVLVYPNEFKG